MGKKELRKRVRSLEQRIREHGTKILSERARPHPDAGRVRHWEAEIKAFRDSIDRARKRLGELK
jgi:hypothetical protein